MKVGHEMLQIKKAVKYGSKLRLAMYGPSGSGKTYTSLAIATAMSKQRVLVIDSERGSASKYADVYDFDVIELENFSPQSYTEAIRFAGQSKEHDIIVIDSISQEWNGKRGALEQVSGNFTKWSTVTPLHNDFVDAMLSLEKHLIVTMRAKEGHVVEQEDGKQKPSIKKVGMEPIQREGIQYEYDVVGMLDMDNTMCVVKTRCPELNGMTFSRAGMDFVELIVPWLDGTPPPPKVVSRDQLNVLFSTGKKAGLYANVEEFTVFVQLALGSDIPVDLASLTNDQACDVEARIANHESLPSKAS